jgi:hypothetical protein
MFWKITEAPIRDDNPTLSNIPAFRKWTDVELKYLAFATDTDEDNPFLKHPTQTQRRKHIIKELDGVDFFTKPPSTSSHSQKSVQQWALIIENRNERFINGATLYQQAKMSLLTRMVLTY